jgi:protein O-GlcNAc transferase
MPPPGKIRSRARAPKLPPLPSATVVTDLEGPMPPEAKTIPTLAQTVQQALILHRQGRLAEAERLYCAALAKQPRQFEVLHFLGVLRLQQGDAREALELLRAATKAKPGAAEVLPSLGAALAALGRHEEALAVYDGILRAGPDDADAGYNRGVVLSHLGRHAEALASYDKVLASRPGHVAALFNRGNVLAMFERFEEALASYDRVIALAPRHIDALTNRADALKVLKRHDEAIAAYDRVLRIVPEHADALNNRGNALFELKRYDEAIASLNAALAVKPNDPDVLFNLGRALQEADRDDAALVAFGEALAAHPGNADAWYSRGNSFGKLGRIDEAITDYERAVAIAPDHPHAFDAMLRYRLDACHWQELARLRTEEISRRVAGGKPAIHPLKLLCFPIHPAIQLQCAQSWVGEKTRGLQTPSNFKAHPRDRLRIAYLSADFRVHAVAMLIAELFELHDRSRFELLAISFGSDDGSQMRSRIVQSVDQFHDVSARNELDSAKLIKDLEVDIAVDLMGHTRHARIGILAPRPAPIQVSYLGYPGTTGADFIDYVIADPIVLPFADQPFYSERIVHVPDCYQVNDKRRAIASQVPTRRQAGLPEQAFAFCCFNNSFKITAEVFEVWMRLLRQVDASVLWLLECNEVAGGNLRREAEARGIDPGRLIFAPFVDAEVNLARLSLVDLFLDTLPYNAHTTASDALWVGVPLVTCAGTTFAGRVAASLLHAAGLPELVTRNLQEYEALALKLATEPPLLQSIRRKLAENRPYCPLFDTDRFRRHIEAAYETMWDLYRCGEPPRNFRVDPIEV